MVPITSSLLALALSGVAHGFIGYGITLMTPTCAVACRTRISSSELACSTRDGAIHGSWHGHGPAMDWHTLAPCFAEDTHFLTSMALCIYSGCGPELKSWEREKYWAENIADVRGANEATIAPKWLYGEALAVALKDVEDYGGLDNVPVIVPGALLNHTGRPNPSYYAQTVATNNNYSWAEIYHSRYGLITLLVSVCVPILLTWAHYIPYYHHLIERLSPFLDMAIFGGYNVRVLPRWLGNPPTLGQSIMIILFFGLNLVAIGADIKTIQPHNMFPSHYVNLLVNLSNRTGVICFALSPLVLLMATRNNILLWLSDWSHGTFVMLHRWTARAWVLQAVMHSILEIMLYARLKTYEKNATKPYWIAGAASTVASVVLLATAITWMRRSHYETFLVLHIILALVIFITAYYHVYLIYKGSRGYEYWLYATFAIWGGDRVWRVWKAVLTGAHRSTVRDLGGGIVRVDIPDVRWPHTPGAHGYVYFPSLSWRFWENHPFSVVSTASIERASRKKTNTHSGSTPSPNGSQEKDLNISVTITTSQSTSERSSTGVTLFVKKGRGLTGRLVPTASLLTWLEGPYHDRSSEAVVRADRLVCLAGGVGITGVLGHASTHNNSKLYWSLRDSDAALAQNLEDMTTLSVEESEVKIGERFNVRQVLEAEAALLNDTKRPRQLGVIVCGPPGLCDEAREVVTRMGRQRAEANPVFILAVEAFCW
jgi:uncharacterized membrane protein YozB (DUF420 family)